MIIEQKNVHLPSEWIDPLQKFYEENREALNELDINSVPKLIQVMANFGRVELENLVKLVEADLACERSLKASDE